MAPCLLTAIAYSHEQNGGHCQSGYYVSPPQIAAFEHRTYCYLKEFVESHSIPCDSRATTGVHGF